MKEITQQDIWKKLNEIDVSIYIKQKGKLDYLPWSVAIGLVKPCFDIEVKVYENDLGFNYHTDGITCWVKVGVKISKYEEIEFLPIMDFKNKSMKKEAITSVDVNKAIKRATVKALASYGLGIKLYAGEELPSGVQEPYDTLKEMQKTKDNLDLKNLKDVESAKVFILELYAFETDAKKKAEIKEYGLELKGILDEANTSN